MAITVYIKRLNKGNDELPLPAYETEGSAGMDIRAGVEDDMIIKPKEVALVPTGLAIALPQGYECQVRSRSGLAAKSGIFALNAPGTVDSDYRGEIKVILANFSDKEFTVRRGDRIAQLVFAQYEKVVWSEQEMLEDTLRGAGGFGSTGV